MKENSEILAEQIKSAGVQTNSEPTIDLVTSKAREAEAGPCKPMCIPNCQPACVPAHIPSPGPCHPDCFPKLIPPKPPRPS